MNKIDMIFSFILGAAAGSVVTWEVVKYKFDLGPYEDIIEEGGSENSELTSVEGIEGVKKNAKNIIETQEYVAYNKSEEKEDDESMNNTGPYVITPDEYDYLTIIQMVFLQISTIIRLMTLMRWLVLNL